MVSGPITSWEIDRKTMETVRDFIFRGSKITADGDCSHEIKTCLLLGRKVMTYLDSILKSRDVTLPTKVRLVKAMAFPVVMYGIEKGKERKGKSLSRVCLCDPMDCSPPGFSIHGIFQAGVLEWVAISFSNGIESWTIKKTECPRIDAFELWCWRRLLSPFDCKEIQPVYPKGNQS